MLAHIVRRILATIPVMAFVALFVFSLLYIAPGDPAVVIAGDQASPEDVEKIRKSLGLDRPFLVRFGEWSGQILRGDLGTSMFTGMPVTTLIGQRLEPTLSLMVVTLVLSVAIAVPMGVAAAWKAGSWLDRSLMGFAVLGFSVPVFVVGYVLAYVFALELDWFPVQGYTPLSQGHRPVAHEPGAAGHRARMRLYRADRAHHAGLHAGGAAAGLHPHRARQGHGPGLASCSCTRSRMRRCRSSP